MSTFESKIAVITGGGTGMGRELVNQLASAGCHVSMCDVSEENMNESLELAMAGAPDGTVVTSFVADVSDADRMEAFAAHVREVHDTDHVHYVFNNAGIGGGGSMIVDSRKDWETVFNVCWGGVYNGTRSFLAMLVASADHLADDETVHIVNTSSVNGFYATIAGMAHTSYSAAKFAVKGFTEALLFDLANNAPHVKAHVVMPGHIGTSIVINSGELLGRSPKEMDEDDISQVRLNIEQRGIDVSGASDEDIRNMMQMQAEMFRDAAPMTASEAATVILDAVRTNNWRVLVGEDAHALDEFVRNAPQHAYTPEGTAEILGNVFALGAQPEDNA